MHEIWANRLIAGTKTWDEVLPTRKTGVKAALQKRVAKGEITQEQMDTITGETTGGTPTEE